MLRQESHIIRGMTQDTGRNQFNPQYAYENYNIRIYPKGDNEELVVTNEKGTAEMTIVGNTIHGVPIGYAKLPDDIILFTAARQRFKSEVADIEVTQNENVEINRSESGITEVKDLLSNFMDRIYDLKTSSLSTDSIQFDETSDYLRSECLFEGDLNFNVNYPIETLPIVETENIQKVYWVDGLNQPRMFNIKYKNIKNRYLNNNSFDFVQTLKLNEEVSIERSTVANGQFSAGAIQYCFTYFTKYGQETNIFYTSPLFYLSYNNRGGSPDEKINTAFTIHITGLDNQFEYVRIYSLLRTTQDAQPHAKLVTEIEIQQDTIDETVSVNDALQNGSESSYATIVSDFQIYNDGVEFTDDELNATLTSVTLPDYLGGSTVNMYYLKKEQYGKITIVSGDKVIGYNNDSTGIYVSQKQDVEDNGIGYVLGISVTTDTSVIIGGHRGNLQYGTKTEWEEVVIGKYIAAGQTQAITYTDTGTNGEDVDPLSLLYKGGETIAPYTMTQKDNTLFFGNIKITRPAVATLNLIDKKDKDYTPETSLFMRQISLGQAVAGGSYSYNNQLFTNTSTFKVGDTYRLGVQFQYKTGKWSDPLFVEDFQIQDDYQYRPYMSYTSDSEEILNICGIHMTLPSGTISKALSNGYMKARPVVVMPQLKDRKIIAQGLVAPTVFSPDRRKKNNPYVQSSWYFRPFIPQQAGFFLDFSESSSSTGDFDSFPYADDEVDNINKGSIVEFRHLQPILQGATRGAEIQGGVTTTDATSQAKVYNSSTSNLGKYYMTYFTSNDSVQTTYRVDQSILTFHSPEVEFDDNLSNVDYSDLKFRIVGIAPFTGAAGDISITTDTGPINTHSTGFYHYSTVVENKDNGDDVLSSDPARKLVSGLFYMDWLADDAKDSDKQGIRWWARQTGEIGFLISPWHRNGSLNNDIAKNKGADSDAPANPAYTTIETAKLKVKKEANMMFAQSSQWLTSYWEASGDSNHTGISKIQLFNSDQMTLTRIPQLKNSTLGNLNYYGNTDTVITSNKEAQIVVSDDLRSTLGTSGGVWSDISNIVASSTISEYVEADPTSTLTTIKDLLDGLVVKNDIGTTTSALFRIRPTIQMKYKSTPHIIFALNKLKTNSDLILPTFKKGAVSVNKIDSSNIPVDLRGIDKSAFRYILKYEYYQTSKPFSNADYDWTAWAAADDEKWTTFKSLYGEDTFTKLLSQGIYWIDSTYVNSQGYGILYKITIQISGSGKYRLTYRTGNTLVTPDKMSSNVGDQYAGENVSQLGFYINADSAKSTLTDNWYKGVAVVGEANNVSRTFLVFNDKGRIATNEGRNSVYVVRSADSITDTTTEYGKIASQISTSYTVQQDTLPDNCLYTGSKTISQPMHPWMFIGELYRDQVENRFGGTSDEALKHNIWYPAGEPVSLKGKESVTLTFDQGDTWYQRYDCLKTYPFTEEDQNQIIEIGSFMCETHINIDGRYDRNRGDNSNLNVSPKNFNLMNKAYSQLNNFFTYQILDYDYYRFSEFPNEIIWSLTKQPAEEIDTWSNITLANTLDVDGDKGYVRKLVTWNNEIYNFQDRGISNVQFNSRVQIPTSDNNPIEITNSQRVDGNRYISENSGLINKWSMQCTPYGIYYIDNLGSSFKRFNGQQIQDLSAEQKMQNWFINNVDSSIWNPNVWAGFTSAYDQQTGDVYLINSDRALVFNEKANAFTSFMSYGKVPQIVGFKHHMYAFYDKTSVYDDCIPYKMFAGKYNDFFGARRPYSITIISNQNPTEDKIFNNIYFRTEMWDKSNRFVPTKTFDTIRVWNEHQDTRKHDPRPEIRNHDVKLSYSPIRGSNLKKKFNVWRLEIPRDSARTFASGVDSHSFAAAPINRGFNRIRNPWVFIKLSNEDTTDYNKLMFTDLVVDYYMQ